jgi:hypothetical protein
MPYILDNSNRHVTIKCLDGKIVASPTEVNQTLVTSDLFTEEVSDVMNMFNPLHLLDSNYFVQQCDEYLSLAKQIILRDAFAKDVSQLVKLLPLYIYCDVFRPITETI